MERRPFTSGELTGIVERFMPMVYNIAKKRVSDTDAYDVSQDVFLQFVKHQDRFWGRDMERIKAWLIRVAINRCNKLYRSSWFRRTVSYDDAIGHETRSEDWSQDNAGSCASAESIMELYIADDVPQDGLNNAVYDAVKSLPEAQYQVIHLRMEGYSVKEIADILELTEGATKTRISRAYDRLEVLLKGLVIHEEAHRCI